ncbi:MAG: ABC-2 transporter permease [Firmicutes bacterium]|nr:ABC-2 transporter permease [Bacillota bacterium]
MTVLRLFLIDVKKLFSIRQMAFFILLPAVLAFNGWFVSIAYLVYLYLVPYGMFNYDDNAVADNLYGALPVRREHMVTARYLFAIFCQILMIALMLAVNTVFGLLLNRPVLAEDFLASLAIGLVAGLIFIAAAFPLVLKQGLRKANNNVLMIFVLDFIILGLYGDNLRQMSELPQINGRFIVLCCLIILIISYAIALRFFKKREFFDYVPLGAVQRARRKR